MMASRRGFELAEFEARMTRAQSEMTARSLDAIVMYRAAQLAVFCRLCHPVLGKPHATVVSGAAAHR